MSIQTYSIGVASDLHASELKPVPVGVQLSGSARSHKYCHQEFDEQFPPQRSRTTLTAYVLGLSGDYAPDEAEMHSQWAVDAWAVDAQEHAVGNAGPAGILGGTVEAHLSKKPEQTPDEWSQESKGERNPTKPSGTVVCCGWWWTEYPSQTDLFHNEERDCGLKHPDSN